MFQKNKELNHEKVNMVFDYMPENGGMELRVSAATWQKWKQIRVNVSFTKR